MAEFKYTALRGTSNFNLRGETKKVLVKSRSADKYPMVKLYVSGITLLLFSLGAFATPGSLTYQGRIKNSQGQALEVDGVRFEFSITSPNGTCVLYRETSGAIDMRNSSGVFDVPIGTGTKIFPVAAEFKLLDSFDNSTAIPCEGGGTYTPVTDDKRLLRVQFHDGIGWKLITPDNEIRSVPYAGHAKLAQSALKLGSNVASDFVTKATLPICGAGTYLRHIAPAGTFECTAPVVSGANITGNITGSSAGFTGNLTGDVSGTQSSTSVDRIKGTPVVNTGLAAGKILKFDGTNWAPSDDNSGVAGAITSLTGAVTSSGSPVATVTLIDSGVTAGTYSRVTVSAKGLVTAASNATATDMPNVAGDVTSTAGLSDTKVEKVQGVAVASTTPLLGQVLVYDNTKWNTQYFGFGQLRSTVTGNLQMPAACGTANKTLNWSAITDTFTCADIAISSSQVSGLGTAAAKNFGTSAGNLVELDGTGKVPAALLPATGDNLGNHTATTNLNMATYNITGAGKILLGDGTWSAPSLTFTGNTNTGLSNNGGIIRFTSGGSLAIDLSSSTMQLNGSYSPYMRLGGGVFGAANPGYAFGGYSTTGMFANTNMLGFSVNGAEKLRIASDGKIGIGTTSPSYKVHISTGTSTNATSDLNGLVLKADSYNDGVGIRDQGVALQTGWAGIGLNRIWNNGNFSIGAGYSSLIQQEPTNDRLEFIVFGNAASAGTAITGTTAMAIQNSTGNVGIGTTSPSAKLEVNGGIKQPTYSAISAIRTSGGTSSSAPWTSAYVLAHLGEVYQWVGAGPILQDSTVGCAAGPDPGVRFEAIATNWDGPYKVTFSKSPGNLALLFIEWTGWQVSLKNSAGTELANGVGQVTAVITYNTTLSTWTVDHMIGRVNNVNFSCF